MTAIAPYRIISYILLPIAALFGLMGLVALLFALVNPINAFMAILICVIPVYIILSFIFFINVVENSKKRKGSLKKWIIATGIITSLIAIVFLFDCITLLYTPDLIAKIAAQGMAMQKNMPPISSDLMIKAYKGCLYFFAFVSTTLIIHVYETFKLLKQFADSFIGNNAGNQEQP